MLAKQQCRTTSGTEVRRNTDFNSTLYNAYVKEATTSPANNRNTDNLNAKIYTGIVYCYDSVPEGKPVAVLCIHLTHWVVSSLNGGVCSPRCVLYGAKFRWKMTLKSLVSPSPCITWREVPPAGKELSEGIGHGVISPPKKGDILNGDNYISEQCRRNSHIICHPGVAMYVVLTTRHLLGEGLSDAPADNSRTNRRSEMRRWRRSKTSSTRQLTIYVINSLHFLSKVMSTTIASGIMILW